MIKNIFEDELPTSGGNSYITKIELENQKAISMSMMPDFPNQQGSKLSKSFEAKQYNLFMLMNFQADYFTNIWDTSSPSFEINHIINITKRLSFIHGLAAVYKCGDNFIPLYIKTSQRGANGLITRIVGYSGITVLSQNALIINENNLKEIVVEGADLKNLAILQWDTCARGAYIKFLPFLNSQKDLLAMLATHALSYNKKYIYKVNDKSTTTSELEAYYNPTNPFIINVGDTAGISNRFEEASGESAATSSLKDFILFHDEYYYSLLGRRSNVDEKRERNVSDEIEASQSNFDILENEHLNYLRMFIQKMNVLTGLNIEVKRAGEFRKEQINEEENNGI